MIIIGAVRAALANDLVGIPRIVDGDTVQIGANNIRLEGIDAPESDQLCLDQESKHWACGVEARDHLLAKTAGKIWTCHSNSFDRFGRALAMCEVDGLNINRWMVREGWALSFVRYSHEYNVDEISARERKIGLWSGAFIAPWAWRRRNKSTLILGAVVVPKDAQSVLLSAVSAETAPAPNCVIKGNINRKGECIYHLPGARNYGTIKMDFGKRRRWFCTEAEAQAAGCRHAKN